jgi:hypothetical protein
MCRSLTASRDAVTSIDSASRGESPASAPSGLAEGGAGAGNGNGEDDARPVPASAAHAGGSIGGSGREPADAATDPGQLMVRLTNALPTFLHWSFVPSSCE